MGIFTIIEVIKKNEQRSIYRVKDNMGTSLIMKLLHHVGYGHAAGIRIRREFELCKMFDVPTVIKVVDQGSLEGAPYITYEDFGGMALKAIIDKQPMELGLFYRLAQEMVAALSACHAKGLVHRDVNASNFIVSTDLSFIKLADFGIADELVHFKDIEGANGLFQGTLDYIAPEQTGRLPMGIDFRTDIYSLGATFYEMLTGTTPFNTMGCDITEAVFIHLTQIPQPVLRTNPSIPKMLSDMVAKMLAKDPSERYQSIFGVREDLTRLKLMHDREQYQYFEVGQRDVSPTFKPSKDLFSRWAIFDAIIPGGRIGHIDKPKYQLIKGGAQCGKSTLLEAVSKLYNQQGHDIIEIKGDKELVNRSYGALEIAIEQWVKKVQASSAADVHVVKELLMRVIGPNLGLLTHTFRILEMIVGEQETQISANPLEHRTRFNQAVVDLFSLIRGESGYLLILVDNLNQLDDATIRLLTYLLNSQLQFVDFIGSHNAQYLSAAFIELTESVPVIQHTIEPFTLDDVENFIKLGFKWDLGTNQALSEILYEKTHGNPGHLIEIIDRAVNDRIIFFDFLTGRWHFDVTQQDALGVAPNVLDLQMSIYDSFDTCLREILEIAVLMPRKFSVDRFHGLIACDPIELLNRVAQLVDLGFLKSSHRMLDVLILDYERQITVPLVLWFADEEFKVAILARMTTDQKKNFHILLGTQLFDSLPAATQHDKAHLTEEMRYHFNASELHLLTDAQRHDLIELNLAAAINGKMSVAYDVALLEAERAKSAFLTTEIDALSKLAFEVLLLEAELRYLNRDFSGSEYSFSGLLKRIREDSQKIEVNRLRLQLYINQGETHKVLNLAMETLQILGYPFNEAFGIPIISGQLLKFQWSKYIYEPSKISQLKSCTDENAKMILEILNLLISVSYLLSKVLFIRIILTMLDLSFKHGMMRLTPFSFATYGIVEVGLFKRYKRALAIGKASLEAAKRSGDWEVLAKVNFTIGFFLNHWVMHIREAIAYLIDGKEQSRLSGNMVYFAYNSAALMLARLAISDNLKDIYLAAQQDLMHPDIMTDKDVSNLLVAVKAYAVSLTLIDDEDFFDAQQFEKELRNSNMPSILAHHLILKMKRSYLLGDYVVVLQIGEEVKLLLGDLMGLYISVESMYYTALALLKLRSQTDYVQVDEKTYGVSFKRLKGELKRLKRINPVNFAHKFEHVHAIELWLEGRITPAHLEFHNAVRSAHEQGFLFEQGLICEDLSAYYLAVGQMRLSDVFIRESYILFRQLECYVKCEAIKNNHIHIGFERLEKAMFETYQTRTMQSQTHQDYDTQTMVKAAQYLAADKDEAYLKIQITRLMLEITGGQKCVLMLKKENLEVVAQLSHGEHKEIEPSESIQVSKRIPLQFIQFASRSKDPVILGTAFEDLVFSRDPYIKLHRVKSILCVPIWFNERFFGLIYVENNLLGDAFEKVRLSLLQILAYQFALAHDHNVLKRELIFSNQELIRHEANLSELVRERTYELSKTKQEIETLLNEVGQGFLSINDQGLINGQFSRECLHIFGHDITREPFHLLLENHVKAFNAGLVRDVIQKTFQSESSFQSEVYLSLLPQELEINGKIVRLSYRLVNTNHIKQITVNLTDITEKITLEREFFAERQQLKMVLNAMRYQNNVRQSILNLLQFCKADGLSIYRQTHESEQLAVIFRLIHTFKGDFAQWSMQATMRNLHLLETELSRLYMSHLSENATDSLSEQLEAFLLDLKGESIVGEDLSWIEKYLGEDFMEKDRDITITEADRRHIENRLISQLPKEHHDKVYGILNEMTWISLEMVVQQYSQYVQDLAESFGKEVDPIRYFGDSVRLDEVRYNDFFKVLIHLFRNAVQYGIELPDVREEEGKPRSGRVSVSVKFESSRLTMTIEDDGQGLDLPQIVDKAALKKPDVYQLSPQQQMQSIFDFGISTKEEVDEVSGRGVGLSAVQQVIQELGGNVTVYSEPHTFTRFTLILKV